MTTVYEISSDSEDTLLLPQYNCLEEQKLSDSDQDVELLVNKYIVENCSNETEPNHCGGLEPLIKKPKKLEPYLSSNPETTSDDYEVLRILQEKYSTNRSDQLPVEKVTTDNKQQKKLGKEQKKKELEQEKYLKRAAAAANKNEKPTECLKFITARIDPDIIKEEYGDEITKALQEADVAYKIEAQVCPGTVTWIRKVESHADDGGKLILTSELQETDHVLLIMTAKTFKNHVDQNTLCGHVSSVKSLFQDKKITLAVYGFKKLTQSKKNDVPNVHKTRVNYSLTELQIMCSCSVRFLDSPQELALFVAQFTKAIAEIPFKLRRHEEFQKTDFYLSGVNRDCVRVDKTGNGLNRLWKQMLTMFPMARLETAEAISSVYPTVSSLMEAYDRCSSQKEAELLLQDIPVRRAAGPLSSSRKIGPELSKRIYTYLTSIDGDVQL